jgi:hypothetical protein
MHLVIKKNSHLNMLDQYSKRKYENDINYSNKSSNKEANQNIYQ